MTFEFYNEWHLGDNIFHINFMRKLTYMKGDCFVYYVKPEYIPELNKHIIGYEKSIHILPIEQKPSTAINAWIGVIYYQHQNKYLYDKFYIDWFNYLTNLMYNEYLNIDIINDYKISDKIVDVYNCLVINSVPHSMQFDYSEPTFNQSITNLASRCKLITTKKIPNIPCTLELGYSLVDIGNICRHVKCVIAVNTAPITTCFSTEALKNVDLWIIGDNKHSYSFNNFFRCGSTVELCKFMDSIQSKEEI